jgi:phage terminase small subunit
MLTPKQEKFVQNLVKGMSQREAYKNSYNASNMKDETIDVKASILFKKDKIRVRYDELIERTAKKTILSVQERKELLTKIAKGEEYETYSNSDGEIYTTPPRIDTRLKAIEQLNKMDGVYIQKVESNSNITIDNPYKELSIEELKKLAGD